MLVYLVRHGQSYNTHPGPDDPAPINPPLTPVGQAEARLVAQRLKAIKVGRLISSPMVRTIETARIIADVLGLPVEVWPRCYEYRATPGYPCWGARELRARYPGLTLPADFADDDWHYGDESPESGEQRAEDFVEWLRTGAGHSAARRMAVVTHGTFTRLVLCRMFGAPLELMRRLAMDNTAVSTLEVSEKGSRVLGINDTSHLIGMDGLDPVLGITR